MLTKAVTQHGTYYLIDLAQGKAKRVPAQGRGAMHEDLEWFDFCDVTAFDSEPFQTLGPIMVGKRMYFRVASGRFYDWRVSTEVMSLELVNEEGTGEING
jgi:hypothetical protein